MKPLLIWSLNATEGLLKANCSRLEKIGGAGTRLAGTDGMPGRFETKADPDCRDGPNNLMPEDEYFIPIAAKCLGRWLEDPSSSVSAIRTFHETRLWARSQDQPHPWSSYWSTGLTQATEYRQIMHTEDKKGYYEILFDAAKTHRNVLIAYSEGGLVARYLAYLDEYIFAEKRQKELGGDEAVSAVITVQSSNFGSPLANPCNREKIFDLVLRLLLIVLNEDPGTKTPALALGQKGLHFANLDALLNWLEAQTKTWKGTLFQGAGKEVTTFAQALRKWSSGLRGRSRDPYEATAFTDLNVRLINQPGSVLHAVTEHPTSRWIGSVIGSDHSTKSILLSVFDDFLDALLQIQTQWSGSEVSKKLGQIERLIDNTYLPENACEEPLFASGANPPHSPTINALADLYQKGRGASPGQDSLGKKAHDFVIPSAYQSLPLSQTQMPRFVGELTNPSANHNSGKDPSDQGGQGNLTRLETLLSRMKEHGL